MDKKLQVFISSTYKDMIEERQGAVEEILECGHIPAGMELFSADDKKQFDVIKKWIRESDIFLLILGGRYGSTQKSSGKSYIQLEYEYAKHIGKKPIAVVLSNKGIAQKLEDGTYSMDNPEHLYEDYKNFKSSVLENRLCDFFDDKQMLKNCISALLRNCEKNNHYSGWIKGDTQSSLYSYPYIIRSQEFMLRYIDMNHIELINDFTIEMLVDGVQYFSDRYAWNAGGKILMSSQHSNQVIVDEFKEGAFDVYTIRLEEVSTKGKIYNICIKYDIADCKTVNHQYLGVNISYPSDHLMLGVEAPNHLTLSNCKYNVFAHSADRVPEISKKILPKGNILSRKFSKIETGKRYNIEWKIN